MFEGLRKFFLSKILRRKYYRTGKCKACGKCCTQIYVKHYKHVVSDEKEFEKLQYLHRFYTYLKVIGKDDIGLIFECKNLDPETHKCKIHKSRPGICRRQRLFLSNWNKRTSLDVSEALHLSIENNLSIPNKDVTTNN